MTAIVTPATNPKPLCVRCSSNPVLGALSVCKSCLKRQADSERREREKRQRPVQQKQEPPDGGSTSERARRRTA